MPAVASNNQQITRNSIIVSWDPVSGVNAGGSNVQATEYAVQWREVALLPSGQVDPKTEVSWDLLDAS